MVQPFVGAFACVMGRLQSPDDGAHPQERTDHEDERTEALFLGDAKHYFVGTVGIRDSLRTVVKLSRLDLGHNGGGRVQVAARFGMIVVLE
ncbi:MAG: hypothetical protein RI897_3630 [Verrucomicrobiota bacterium]|jgi:hypothetical protein